MARKTTTKRRRSRRRSPVARRRRTSSGRSPGFGRGGFINPSLLMAGAAVGAGLFAAPFLAKVLPASLQSNRYTLPLATIGLGLVSAGALRKVSPTLSLAFASGLIGSGVVQIVSTLTSKPAAAPAAGGVSGYMTSSYLNGYQLASPELGAYQLADGSVIDGYMTSSGTVVDSTGAPVGYLAAA